MLEEAVEVIRKLWGGEEVTHRGRHYTVEQARLYTLPDEPPEIYVAAAKPQAAQLAGRIGDGLVSTAPDGDLLSTFDEAGGRGKPKVGKIHVAYDEDEEAGHERANRLWPNLALAGRRPGAARAPRLRGVRGECPRQGRRRVDAGRPRSGAVPRADPRVRGRRLHASLHPPDRRKPTGVRRVRGPGADARALRSEPWSTYASATRATESTSSTPVRRGSRTRSGSCSSILRDGGDVEPVAGWVADAEPSQEIWFRPARVLLQDFTGVPAVVDLAAMRDVTRDQGGDPKAINPLIPAELVIDHSVQVDEFASRLAIERNVELEFERNRNATPSSAGGRRVRRLPRGAAQHRHLPPGQPRVPRARRRTRTASRSPTPS